jgi:hypothetical protein
MLGSPPQWLNASEHLIKSFDKLRTNGKLLIPVVVSLSNHTQIRLNQRLPGEDSAVPAPDYHRASRIATILRTAGQACTSVNCLLRLIQQLMNFSASLAFPASGALSSPRTPQEE